MPSSTFQRVITLLRGALGKSNWVAGMMQPEISFHVYEISTKIKTTTILALNLSTKSSGTPQVTFNDHDLILVL